MILDWESCQSLGDLAQAFEGGGAALISGGGPHGGDYVQLNNTGQTYKKFTDTAVDKLWFSGWLRCDNAPFGVAQARIRFYEGDPTSGGILHCHFRVGEANVEAFDASGSSLGAESIASINDTWTHFEFYIEVDDTNGVMKCWVNDTLIVDESGVDTQNGGTGVVDYMRFRGYFNFAFVVHFDFSHLVWQDGNGVRLGQHEVHSDAPDSDVSVDFTPTGSGTNFGAVASNDGDTSYNESSTDGHRDRLGTPASGVPQLAHFAGIKVTAKQDAAGSSQLKIGLRDSGGTEDLSASLDVDPSNYRDIGYVSKNNPNTGELWTTAELSAMEGLYELDLDTPAVRVTQVRIEALERQLVPDRPEISVDSIGLTTLDLSATAFSGPGGTTHAASRWQVADITDGAFTAPYFDSGEDATNLTSITATGLPMGTTTISRVRYLNDLGLWSEWSLTETATTGATPGKPSVTIVSTTPDSIELSVSDFVAGSSGDPQKSITYQITLVSDPLFSSPIVDYTSEFDGEFGGKTFFGLNLFLNQYLIRVLVTDTGDVDSAWSDTAGPTGLATTGQFYTPFGERELGFQLRMADWAEVVEADGESTWTNLTDPDAICLVVSRREIVTGSPDGIDPIRWEGFPQVDKQIVWTRVKFDTVGEGPNPCPSSDPGTSSPNGFICRITEGLEAYEDFSDPALTGWRVVRNGAGSWSHVPDRGTGTHGVPAEVLGNDALGYQHVVEDAPDALILWDAVGIVTAGKWFQYRAKMDTQLGDPFTGPWTGMALAAQNDEEQYHAQSRHRCGIFINWTYVDWWKHTGPGFPDLLPTYHSDDILFGGKLAYFIGRGSYEYLKGSVVPAGQDGEYGDYELEASPAFSSRRGFRSEHRVAFDAEWKDGQIGLVVQNCGSALFAGYTQGQALVLFDHAALCTNNFVTVQGLPEDWYVVIGLDTVGSAFWQDFADLVGDAAGNDKMDDFDGQAYPADFMRLYDDEDNLIEEWYVGDNALGEPGIWGGDVYRINVGGVGVGPIGGVSLRVSE